MIARGLGAAADAILSTLLAPTCASCDALLEAPTRGAVCPQCWAGVRPFVPPLCTSCALPIIPAASRGLKQPLVPQCPECRKNDRSVDYAATFGSYEGTLRQIVHAFKYHPRRSLARPLAGLMRQSAGELLIGIDLVVPVPLHWRRRHARGFNQAEDLAWHIIGRRPQGVLRRVRSTEPQVTLAAQRRRGNVRNAFQVVAHRGRLVRNSVVLLVDDVATTGATLEECARVLKIGGAREVRAVTVARAVQPWR